MSSDSKRRKLRSALSPCQGMDPAAKVPVWAWVPFALAAVAQFILLPRQLGWPGLLIYLAAIAGLAALERAGAWTSLVPSYPEDFEPPQVPLVQAASPARRRVGSTLILLTIACLIWNVKYYAAHVRAGNLLYIASLFLFWLGSRLRETRSPALPRTSLWLSRGLLAAIIAWGAFMRLHRLYDYPENIDAEEAIGGMVEVLPASQAPLDHNYFRSSHESQPYLRYAVFVPFVRWLGSNLTAWRAGSAFTGTLGLIFTYLSVKWFAGRRAALGAASLLASVGYHVQFSRVATSHIQVPLYFACLLFLLLRATRTASRADFALCGIVLGLGVQNHAEARILPLAVLLFFLLAALLEKRFRVGVWRAALLVGLGAIVGLGPLIPFAMHQPEIYLSRSSAFIVSNPGFWRGRAITQVLYDQLRFNFLPWNYFPEHPPYYLARKGPFLESLPALLFVVGLVYACARIRVLPYAFLLAFTVITTVIGGVLTAESPHATRLLVLIVPVVTLASLGLLCLARIAADTFGLRRREGAAALVVALAISAGGYYQYFIARSTYYRGPTPTVRLFRYMMARDPARSLFIADIDILHKDTIFKNYQVLDAFAGCEAMDHLSVAQLRSELDKEGEPVTRVYYASYGPQLPNIVRALNELCSDLREVSLRREDGTRGFVILECALDPGRMANSKHDH